jgi:hypothetical protein
MATCVKCEKSIRPVSLAANVDGEFYHPTCIACDICEAPLWGKGFEIKGKKLVCEKGCGGGAGLLPPDKVPRRYLPNANPIRPVEKHAADYVGGLKSAHSLKRRPSSAAQRQQIEIIAEQTLLQETQNKNVQANGKESDDAGNDVGSKSHSTLERKMSSKSINNENKRKQSSAAIVTSSYTNPPPELPKKCSNCNEFILFKKKFIEDEKGNVICQPCVDKREAEREPAEQFTQAKKQSTGQTYTLTCATCGDPIEGAKYHRNVLGDISCVKCETSGARCAKCKILFKLNEVATNHAKVNNGAPYHEHCFTCWQCNKRILSTNFNLTESNTPMCVSCFENSKLAKCPVCRRPITGEYIIFESVHMHRNCFKCSQCSKVINSEGSYYRNKSNNNLPICANCNTKNNRKVR